MREKLIELMKKTPIAKINGHIAEAEVCFVSHVFESMADHLIANGVTIQKWIPVTERLPEYGQTVVVRVHYPFDEDARMEVTPYNQNYNPHFWKRVTHWMPLPEPPKGG